MGKMFKKYIGPKSYYQTLLKIGAPLAAMSLFSSCMTIIDSIMVSSIGMVTAVGNAYNVLMLHDYICWGISSGCSIFIAQYFGAKQKENLSKSFGVTLSLLLGNALLWFSVAGLFGKQLLYFYLNDADVVYYSYKYLRIAKYCLIPMALNQAMSSTLRSTHNTKVPFYCSTIQALVNVGLNYLFIYVLKIGVEGAAIASLIAFVTTFIVMLTYIAISKPCFFISIKHMFSYDLNFMKRILEKTIPIVFNESFFGFGTSLFNKAFGMLGALSMNAYYIASEVFELFGFIIWGLGASVSIQVGTLLGANELEQAKKESYYQFGLGLFLGLFLMLLTVITAPIFMALYSVSDPFIRTLGITLLYIFGLKGMIRTFNYMMFSTLKAGGDSKVLNILDSGIMYLVGLPLAFISAYFRVGDIRLVLLIVQIEQVVRFIFTYKRFMEYKWLVNLTV